jgi:hypothetical protein
MIGSVGVHAAPFKRRPAARVEHQFHRPTERRASLGPAAPDGGIVPSHARRFKLIYHPAARCFASACFSAVRGGVFTMSSRASQPLRASSAPKRSQPKWRPALHARADWKPPGRPAAGPHGEGR